MTLINLDEIEFEPFEFFDTDDGTPETRYYVSEEALRKMPNMARRGEWITKTQTHRYAEPDMIWAWKECSECGCQSKLLHVSKTEWNRYYKNNWNPKLPNFCEECGADMRKE